MKPKIYNVENSMQLLMAVADIKKHPFEYTDCTIRINSINFHLLAKVLSLTNNFVKFHYEWKCINHSNDITNGLYVPFYDDLIYSPGSLKQHPNIYTPKITTSYLEFVIEPAYDATRFLKLLGNRISKIEYSDQITVSNSEERDCKTHIAYLNLKDTHQILETIFNIIQCNLRGDIANYIFLCYINKILYVVSESPITYIGYHDNSTIKINDYLYKIK